LVDRYRLALRNIVPAKYLARPVTKRLSSQRLLDISEVLVDALSSLEVQLLRTLRGSATRKTARLILIRLAPNSVFPLKLYVDGVLDRDSAREWAILDTFDMYGPRYDMPQSFRAWRRDLHRLQGGEVERCIVCGQGNAGTVRRLS
jgi:hypothetical protein